MVGLTGDKKGLQTNGRYLRLICILRRNSDTQIHFRLHFISTNAYKNREKIHSKEYMRQRLAFRSLVNTHSSTSGGNLRNASTPTSAFMQWRHHVHTWIRAGEAVHESRLQYRVTRWAVGDIHNIASHYGAASSLQLLLFGEALAVQ